MHLHVLLVASLALTLPAIRDEHFSYLDAARPPRSVLVTNESDSCAERPRAFSPWPLGGFTCSVQFLFSRHRTALDAERS